jgi:hypothetical protein
MKEVAVSTNMSTRTDEQAPSTRELDVELLALDLDTCTRCVGTLANIEEAIGMVQRVLGVTGTRVRVRKTLIESEVQARQHRFETSPTVRINGRDIAFETLESRCDSCTDLCGCDEGTNCRVWRYGGQEYTEAPVGLVVEAILGEVYGETPQVASEPAPYEDVPENTSRFFASRSAIEDSAASSCCSPEEQEVCCEPAAKAPCCGSGEEETCGCQ